MKYESVIHRSSQTLPGVAFTIQKISLARRLELSREIRGLAGRMEFADAGKSFADKVDASVLALEVDRTYLQWGLVSVQGLDIDGQPASPELLIQDGPEDLCTEIAMAIRSECGLSEEERKN